MEKKQSLAHIFAFIALIVAAFLALIGFINSFDFIKFEGKFFEILDVIKEVCLVLGLSISAYLFVMGTKKKKVWLWVYWIAIVLYVLIVIIRPFI